MDWKKTLYAGAAASALLAAGSYTTVMVESGRLDGSIERVVADARSYRKINDYGDTVVDWSKADSVFHERASALRAGSALVRVHEEHKQKLALNMLLYLAAGVGAASCLAGAQAVDYHRLMKRGITK